MIITKAWDTERPPRKSYKCSKAQDFSWSFLWTVVTTIDCSNNLKELAGWLRKIEAQSLPYVGMLGRVKDGYGAKHNRRLNDQGDGVIPHMVFDPLTWVFQIDIDGSRAGSNFNTLSCHERVKVAIAELPFLKGLEMVAQLSNKAGLQGDDGDGNRYEDYLALRLYVRLDKLEKVSKVRKAVSDVREGQKDKGIHVDEATCNANSVLLIRRPELIDTPVNTDVLEAETVCYYEGEALSLKTIETSKVSKKGREEKAKFTGVASALSNSSKKEVQRKLEELAESGHFDNSGNVNRNDAHFQLLSKAERTYGDIEWMGNLIKENRKLLGTRSNAEAIDKTIERIRGNQRNVLECNTLSGVSQIARKEFDFKDVINAPFLNDDNLSTILGEIRKNDYKGIVGVKSSHGTAKTTVLAVILMREMEKYLERSLKVLYICNRISNIHKASKDLRIDSYIDIHGRINKELCRTSTRLAICEHSLSKLFDEEGLAHDWDLIIYDEPENAHTDAATLSNSNQENLRKLLTNANLKVFLDSDLGIHTYGLMERINLENQDRLMLVENTYSHLATKPQIFHEEELDIYVALLRCLEAGETVFLHTGHKDGVSTRYLSSLVNIFNSLMGEDIAFYVDSNNKTKYPDLFKDPDTFLFNKIEQGMRLFIVSPVIQTGWRFSLALFDTTFGIYRNDKITAPHMLQASQRCVGVKKFHWYIGAQSNYTSLDELEATFYKNHAEGKDPIESSLGKIQYELSWCEGRTIEAKSTIATFRSSPHQHLVYMMQDYGAAIEVAPSYKKSERDVFRELLRDAVQLEREKNAVSIHDDINRRNVLLQNFVKAKAPKDWQDTYDYLLRDEQARSSEEAIKELISIIFGNEKERKDWGLYTPHWARSEKAAYALIGKVLDAAFDKTGLNKIHLAGILRGNRITRIVIDAEIFKKDRTLVNLLDAHCETLKSEMEFVFPRKNTTFQKLIKNIAQHLDLKVKGSLKGDVSVKEAKHALIEHYRIQGRIKCPKDFKPEREIKKCIPILKERYKREIELTEEEETFLWDTGKFIALQSTKGIHRIVYDHMLSIEQSIDFFGYRNPELTKLREQEEKNPDDKILS